MKRDDKEGCREEHFDNEGSWSALLRGKIANKPKLRERKDGRRGLLSRWLKASPGLKKEYQVYGQMLAEMVK